LAHHRQIEAQLDTLERIGVALGSPGPVAEAHAALASPLAFFDPKNARGEHLRHTMDEEASLFPRLQGVADPPNEALVSAFAEHAQLDAIYAALRDVAERPGEDATAPLGTHVRALVATYRDHIRREEVEIFPAVERLSQAELRAIGAEMQFRRVE
jgi:hemerythrin-like domain-containing protein